MRCPCGSGLSVGNCQHYKEGDRVEAIKPPTGVEDSQADQIGLGEITAINLGEQNGETHKVMLDSGEEWWYSEDRLRLVTAAKPTPTPSITVGTQVRLTGVVVSQARNGTVHVKFNDVHCEIIVFAEETHHLEVIRQPFKRGEVVYHVGDKDSEPRTVVTDEAEGFVLLSRHVHGTETLEWDATTFERRP